MAEERKFNSAHLKVSWGGVLGNNIDIWSNSLHLVNTDGSANKPNANIWTLEDATDFLNDRAIPGLTAFHNTFRMNSQARLTWIKCVPIGTDGKYVYDTSNVPQVNNLAVQGKGSGTAWNSTLAITLRTAKARGRGHAGRFYPPVAQTCLTQAADGYANAIEVGILADDAKTLLELFSRAGDFALGDAEYRVATMPKVATIEETDQAFEYVTGVEIDRVPDTQRRRVNAVVRNVITRTVVADQD